MRKHTPRELFVPDLKIRKPYLTRSSAQPSLWRRRLLLPSTLRSVCLNLFSQDHKEQGAEMNHGEIPQAVPVN